MLWYVVALAAESTIFPLAEPVNEHRPYLAMLGLGTIAALGAWTLVAFIAREHRHRVQLLARLDPCYAYAPLRRALPAGGGAARQRTARCCAGGLARVRRHGRRDRRSRVARIGTRLAAHIDALTGRSRHAVCAGAHLSVRRRGGVDARALARPPFMVEDGLAVMAPGLLSVTVDGALRHGAPGGQGG